MFGEIYWIGISIIKICRILEYFNSFHDSIKFTIQYSRKEVSFLNVVTYRYGDRINSTLYVKPTNTHSYKYNSTKPLVKDWIQELWLTLNRSSGIRTLIDQNIIFGFRKPKSLQDILVHTDIYGNSTKKKKNNLPNVNGGIVGIILD